MRNTLLFAAVTGLAFLLATGARSEDQTRITVKADPTGLVRFGPDTGTFGKLKWRGGLVLDSSDDRFGGFSGMVISRDGKRIIAVSDAGWWLKAGLTYEKGRLAGIKDPHLAPLLRPNGKRARKKYHRDAEALGPWDGRAADGPLLVGFERRERVGLFKPAKAGIMSRERLIKSPKAISSGATNKELESVARFWQGPLKGWLMAISERNIDGHGNLRAWAWRGRRTRSFSIRRHDDYLITGMSLLPGGKHFVSIERSFSPGSLPGMAIRRFAVKDIRHGGTLAGELLFEGRQPFYRIDNMEAISVHHTDDGEVRLTVMSDDNYNRAIQRTLLLQFALVK